MIPAESLNKEFNTSTTVSQSRAYTFLDSYIYMKNSKYNALYEKNKEILAIEKEALEKQSVDALYFSLTEQTQMLNSVIVRIRNFAQSVRNDVVQNLLQLIPDANEINDYEEAITSLVDIPKVKVVNYEISAIEYPNMAVFSGLFKKEMREFTKIRNETANISDPFIHHPATEFLIRSAKEYAHANIDILSKEKFYMTTAQDLNSIKEYFRKKSIIINGVNRDFRTFYFYLRQYRMLQQVMVSMKPTVRNDGKIYIGDIQDPLNDFNDYLVLYKHYTMMIKYLMDIVSSFDSKFFNKIYAIQSNIEVYRSTMNYVISYYKGRARNINESFEDIGDIIGGSDNVKDFLTDNSNEIIVPEDSIQNVNVPQSEIEYPEDVYDYDLDDDELDEYPYYSTPLSIYDNKKSYLFDALDHNSASDRASILAETTFMYLPLNNLKVLHEDAEAASMNYQKVLEGMVRAILLSNDKFKESAKRIREEYAGVLDRSKSLDPSSMDLSGIQFDTYKYSKGVEIMHRIRIPSFNPNDESLLIEDDGLNYKQKYFKDLYYFNYKGVPINRNKFRGSQAKKIIEVDKLPETFAFFKNFIENYGAIVNTMNNANKRIASVLKKQKELANIAYGEDEAMTEAIAFYRSVNRDDALFNSILHESEEILNDIVNDIEEMPHPDSSKVKLKEGDNGAVDINHEKDQNTNSQSNKPNKEEDVSSTINIDDNAASSAEDAKDYAEAMRIYCKIAYEVNSCRMDIYEEIYETAYRFLKMICDIANNS